MRRDILINTSGERHSIAIIEEGKLVELHTDDGVRQSVNGNIYLGRVDDILPGLSCAFVDIGLPKKGFLHSKEAFAFTLEEELDQEQWLEPPSIEEMAFIGQELIVQVAKEPVNEKGAKLTTNISLPGRFVVLMPLVNRVGVSHRIEKNSERERLRELAEKLRPKNMGLIVRTASEGQSAELLSADINQMADLWERIQNKSRKVHAPSLLHQDLNLIQSILRDTISDELDKIVIDNAEVESNVRDLMISIKPSLADRIEYHSANQPIFDLFGVEKEIDKMLRSKVWLHSGGYIVIDHTEALVAIDVNTGRYIGKKNPDETILRTNLEAAKEIAHQVRLRDIGGVIVIDFIDMKNKAHRKEVVDTLINATSFDRSRVNILDLSELGIVEMTRKCMRESSIASMFKTCPYCRGEGRILTDTALALRLEREILRLFTTTNSRELLIRIHPDFADYLDDVLSPRIQKLGERFNGKIVIQYDGKLSLDGFDMCPSDVKK